MMRAAKLLAVLSAILLGGCSSVTPQSDSQPSPQVTDWALAIPTDVPRAEVVGTNLREEHLASLIPQARSDNISLVSYGQHQMPAGWAGSAISIAKIDDQAIANWGELLDATRAAVQENAPVKVLFGGPQRDELSVKIEPETLVALTHQAAGDQPIIRIGDGGNCAAMIRQQGVQCKLVARVERELGLLHLVVSLAAPLSDKKMLPNEITATCAGQTLRCLTVADALQLIYGDPTAITSPPADSVSSSFAQTSERDDFLIPSNFKRLAQDVPKDATPALATLPGIRYPGPAILGDARALTSFLLQREFYGVDQQERAGWVLFAGDSLRDRSDIQINIDLGGGPRTVRFTLPPQ